MRKQVGEPTHDGEPQPHPLAPVARRIADLVELIEDAWQMRRINADAGVPHFEQYHLATTTGTYQHTTLFGIGQRIGDEILQNPLQQRRVALYPKVRCRQSQIQPPITRYRPEFVVNMQ